eukprot:scaffold459_cov249-Pinguiococcus_pyrenoidosus.AAC.17
MSKDSSRDMGALVFAFAFGPKRRQQVCGRFRRQHLRSTDRVLIQRDAGAVAAATANAAKELVALDARGWEHSWRESDRVLTESLTTGATESGGIRAKKRGANGRRIFRDASERLSQGGNRATLGGRGAQEHAMVSLAGHMHDARNPRRRRRSALCGPCQLFQGHLRPVGGPPREDLAVVGERQRVVLPRRDLDEDMPRWRLHQLHDARSEHFRDGPLALGV